MKAQKFFYRITEKGVPIPGTLARLTEKPITGKWVEAVPVCCETPSGESVDITNHRSTCSSIAYGVTGTSTCPEASLIIKVNGVVVTTVTNLVTGEPANGIIDVNQGDVVEFTLDCGSCGFLAEGGTGANASNLVEIFSVPYWDEDYFDYNGTHTVSFTVPECDTEYVGYITIKCNEPLYDITGHVTNGENTFGVVGATVTATGDDLVVHTTTTDASGNYSFTGLIAQTYTVVITPVEEFLIADTGTVVITTADAVRNVTLAREPYRLAQVSLNAADLDQVTDLSTANFICDTFSVKTSIITNPEIGTNGWFKIKKWAGVNSVAAVIAAMNAAVAIDPVGGTGTSGVISNGDVWYPALGDYFPLILDTVNNVIKTSYPGLGAPDLKLRTSCLYDDYPTTP